MTVFWIATGGLALVVAALMVMALLRGHREIGPSAAFDLKVYKDQLAEIDRDLERGTLGAEEAERMRTEVSRRILLADAKAQAGGGASGQGRGPGVPLAILMSAILLGGGYFLYALYGAPGYPDLPRAARIAAAEAALRDRPSQQDAEAGVPAVANPDVAAEYLDLVTKLRAAVAERPNDLQGLQLLARSEAALGNYSAAWQAQERIVALRGDAVTAKDFADLADMMILAAGGYVSPQAQQALERALARDPQNGVARYYGGLMMAQTGRPDTAFRMWDQLLRRGPDDAPWIPPIREQIEEMAFRAGVANYELPQPAGASGLPGPSREDVEAAQNMTPEERMDMIRGMVGRLSDRLATEGGPPEDWARLIGALVVLEDLPQAQNIWAEAQVVFAETPEALETVRAAARRAGLTE